MRSSSRPSLHSQVLLHTGAGHRSGARTNRDTAFGLEQRLQYTALMGVSKPCDTHGALGVPVPARKTGWNTDGRLKYEALLTLCVDSISGAEAPGSCAADDVGSESRWAWNAGRLCDCDRGRVYVVSVPGEDKFTSQSLVSRALASLVRRGIHASKP
ncbi:hypothetical protein V8E53_013212 [Lactarius tabidus]